jgi:cytochrome P450
VFNQPPSERTKTTHTTIFHEILDSKLPPEEKTIARLAEDGGALVGAGTVTTAWAITVAIFWLLRDAQCLARLKHELSTACPSDSATESVPDVPNAPKDIPLPTLESLPYLSATIQEALRLSYGVASRLARIAPDEELVVPGEKECHIPPNTPVSMTQLLVFRDASIFPSPLTFRPERWIEDPRLHRFQVAFNKGSRICLGKNLAMAEMYLILGALFRKYGSKEVRMDGDVGYLELWDTDENDVECFVDAFIPLPKRDTRGVRCKVQNW